MKRVVLTSSFAAINDRSKGVGKIYSEVSNLYMCFSFVGMNFILMKIKGGLEPHD